MAKKSFFERLTGATVEELNDDVTTNTFDMPDKEDKTKKTTKKIVAKVSKSNEEKTKEAEIETVENPEALIEEGQLIIDVYQTDSDIIIKSTVAGVKPEDLDITITDSTLTVKGERKKDTSISEENCFYQELFWGAFSRSVILPLDVDANKIKASIKNGILTIKLPKIEKEKAKSIKVKAIE